MKTFLKLGLITVFFVVFMMWGMESKSNIQTQINSLQNSLDNLGQELQSLTAGLSKIKQKFRPVISTIKRPGILKINEKYGIVPSDLRRELEVLVENSDNKMLYVVPYRKGQTKSLIVFRSDADVFRNEKFDEFHPDGTGALVLFTGYDTEGLNVNELKRLRRSMRGHTSNIERGRGHFTAEHFKRCSWFKFFPGDFRNRRDSSEEVQKLLRWLKKPYSPQKLSMDESKLSLDQRKVFIADQNSWQRYPIRFTEKDMLNKFPLPQVVDKKRCRVVEGSFTYYNAIPQGSDPKAFESRSKEYIYSDGGWGCCWRSFLNVMNKVKEWLEKKGIIATKKEHFDMGDVRNEWGVEEWKRLERGGGYSSKWIEPAENAELYLRFIKRWYSSMDQKKIKDLLDFRGRLYLSNNTQEGKKSFLKGSLRRTGAELRELREYLGVSSTDIEKILDAFYKDCFDSSNVKIKDFPKFNEKTNPFPVTADNTIYADNIYGFHADGGGHITHVFKGDVHIDEEMSPWEESGWQEVDDIIGGRENVMMFEVFLKDSSSVASQAIQTMRPGVLKIGGHYGGRRIPSDLKEELQKIVEKSNKTLYVFTYFKSTHISLLVFRSDGAFRDEKENYNHFSPKTEGVLVLFMDTKIDKTLMAIKKSMRKKCSWFGFTPEDWKRRDTSKEVQGLLKWLEE